MSVAHCECSTSTNFSLSVYPVQRHSGGDHEESPPPRPVITVSKATQTPPLSPEVRYISSTSIYYTIYNVIILLQYIHSTNHDH